MTALADQSPKGRDCVAGSMRSTRAAVPKGNAQGPADSPNQTPLSEQVPEELERNIRTHAVMIEHNLRIMQLCDNLLAGRDPFEGFPGHD